MNAVLRLTIRRLLLTYRVVLSPDHGLIRHLRRGRRFCGLTPTCSTIAVGALDTAPSGTAWIHQVAGRLAACHRSSGLVADEDDADHDRSRKHENSDRSEHGPRRDESPLSGPITSQQVDGAEDQPKR